MSGPVRIHNRDHQIRFVERKIIIPTIPQDNITSVRIILRRPQDSFVINAGIDHISPDHMGFVLFHFLNGTVMLFEVFQGGKSLYFLGHQVTIGHGVANGHNLQPLFHQYLDDAP